MAVPPKVKLYKRQSAKQVEAARSNNTEGDTQPSSGIVDLFGRVQGSDVINNADHVVMITAIVRSGALLDGVDDPVLIKMAFSKKAIISGRIQDMVRLLGTKVKISNWDIESSLDQASRSCWEESAVQTFASIPENRNARTKAVAVCSEGTQRFLVGMLSASKSGPNDALVDAVCSKFNVVSWEKCKEM